MTPTISIIIIVKNDRGIADTLNGLELQTRPALAEIIVVDASEASVLADIRSRHIDVRWFQFEPAIKNKTSIPEQRNFGIQKAQGKIIVFIDANCVPDTDWLVKLTAPILNGSETMTAGSVRAVNPKTLVNLNSASVTSEYLSSSPTINLAFKRSIWELIGGFDESFLFGSDVDFTWRSITAGNRIKFVKDASVTHEWGSEIDEFRRSFKYGKARARLFLKYPKRIWKELAGDSLYVLVYSIWLLGLPLTYFFPWYPLTLVLLILKNIRYKPIKTVLINLTYTIGTLFGLVKYFKA